MGGRERQREEYLYRDEERIVFTELLGRLKSGNLTSYLLT